MKVFSQAVLTFQKKIFKTHRSGFKYLSACINRTKNIFHVSSFTTKLIEANIRINEK